MAANDYATLIFNQLVSLMTNDAPFLLLVKAGNIWSQNKNQLLEFIKAGNTPEIQVDFTTSTEQLYTVDEHYGETGDDDDAWLETGTFVFSIAVTFDTRQLVQANKLHAQLKALLRASGPTLGLAFVTRYGPLIRADSIGNADPKLTRGSERRVSKYVLTVQTQDDGNAETE